MKNHFEKDNYIFKFFGVSLNLLELFGDFRGNESVRFHSKSLH